MCIFYVKQMQVGDRMLVEFRVKNFKSIRDEQVFSMAANNDESFEDSHVVKSDSYPRRLLKSAAIYGPNAGGKSNLIQAIGFMRQKVRYSADFEDDDNCPFFRLDTSSRNIPSEFEMTFMLDGVRHQYGFSILGRNIMEEWLLVYKTDKPQEWFRRYYDEEKDEDIFKFSSHFKGQKSTWQKSTRRDVLFLSVAVKFNSEQLKPVSEWFDLLTLVTNDFPWQRIYQSRILRFRDESARKEILSFITSAGIDISDIGVKTELRKTSGYYEKTQRESSSETVEREIEISRPVFIHNYGDGLNEEFELRDESIGTQRLLYLSPYILTAMKTGGTIVIDELESSMHPMLARFVVDCFNSSKNKNGAQLIFSTHNTNLLDIKEVFRRDQIWFVERDNDQATALYPLTDFSPRKDASVESGYLSGRYGAVPFLTDFYPDLYAGEGGGDGA